MLMLPLLELWTVLDWKVVRTTAEADPRWRNAISAMRDFVVGLRVALRLLPSARYVTIWCRRVLDA